MRRLNLVLIPTVLLVTAAGAGAQTRTAPSIGDAVRRSAARVITQQGISTRGVYLPQQQQCSNGNGGYGYDGRYDRDSRKDEKEVRKEIRKDRKRMQKDRKQMQKGRRQNDGDEDDRNGGNGAYGCCTNGTYDQNGTYNQGGYDQNGRYDQYGRRDSNGQYDQYGRVVGSRNSGTGTVDARRGNGPIYSNGNGNGVYNGNGRGNSCSYDPRQNQNRNGQHQGRRDNDDRRDQRQHDDND